MGEEKPSLAAVVMASGESRRFGGRNKLLMPVEGKPMLARVLNALPEALFTVRLVVARDGETAALAQSCGARVITHDLPDVSDTIRLGVQNVEPVDGCLFSVGDQPYMNPDTIRRMAALFCESPGRIVRVCYQNKVGNPVIFPAPLLDELKALSVGQSGGTVIRRHEALVAHCPVEDVREMWDVDTLEEYLAAQQSGV